MLVVVPAALLAIWRLLIMFAIVIHFIVENNVIVEIRAWLDVK